MPDSTPKIPIYCSECYHVFYGMPKSKKCAICDNELSSHNNIHPLQYLTCETCHSLYSIQQIERIIPQQISNPNLLCGCQYNCPTTSILNVAQEETYIGNIVLAEMRQCSNCGAVTIVNKENQKKECQSCGSRFVHPLLWDPTTKKLVFSCANPSHGIRLKIRDLIANINQEIETKILKIKTAEEELQKQYLQKRKEITAKYRQAGIKEKLKLRIQQFQTQVTEEVEIASLNQWALIERRKLYLNLHSNPLRCCVYHQVEGNQEGKLQKTNQGCNSLAKVRMMKIVSETMNTVLQPPSPKEQIINTQSHISDSPSSNLTNSTQNYIQTGKDWRKTMVPLIDEHQESIFTTILRPQDTPVSSLPDLSHDSEISPKLTPDDVFESRKKIFYESLPKLQDFQIYLHIALIGFNQNQQDRILNYGVLPMEFSPSTQRIGITRDIILHAYWADPKFFKEFPLIFENFLATEQGSQFYITDVNMESISIQSNEKAINTILRETPDINSIQNFRDIFGEGHYSAPIFIQCYYPLRAQHLKSYNQFLFQFTLQYSK